MKFFRVRISEIYAMTLHVTTDLAVII